MASLSFRPRPIDVNKALPIIRKELDGTEIDELSSARRSVPMMPTGMEKEDEEEAHIQEAIKQSLKMKNNDRVDIPTPRVIIVDGYDDAPNPNPFIKTSTYIHYRDKTREEEDLEVEYDADDEDTEFIEKLNASQSNKKYHLTESKYELLVDRLEKEAGRLDGTIPSFNDIEKIVPGIKSSVVQEVYDFWLKRREFERTPLNHKFLKPPDPEDPDPYKAFRKREPESQKKKGRKNDTGSLYKMRHLRQEMERARTLLEMIKKREKLKSDYCYLLEQIFDAQLADPVAYQNSLSQLSSSSPSSNSISMSSFSSISNYKNYYTENETSPTPSPSISRSTSSNNIHNIHNNNYNNHTTKNSIRSSGVYNIKSNKHDNLLNVSSSSVDLPRKRLKKLHNVPKHKKNDIYETEIYEPDNFNELDEDEDYVLSEESSDDNDLFLDDSDSDTYSHAMKRDDRHHLQSSNNNNISSAKGFDYQWPSPNNIFVNGASDLILQAMNVNTFMNIDLNSLSHSTLTSTNSKLNSPNINSNTNSIKNIYSNNNVNNNINNNVNNLVNNVSNNINNINSNISNNSISSNSNNTNSLIQENEVEEEEEDIFNNENMKPKRNGIPPFRGRCRVGRGGRIIFDRRPIPTTTTNGIVHTIETDSDSPSRISSLIALYTNGNHPLSAGRSDPDKLLKQMQKLENSTSKRKKQKLLQYMYSDTATV